MSSSDSSLPNSSHGVQVMDDTSGLPTTLLLGEADDTMALYGTGSNSAQEAEASARDPLELIASAQAAIACDASEQSISDLWHALREIRGVVTLSNHSPLAVNLQSLAVADMRRFLWGSFELCCAYLIRPNILEENLVIALEAIFALHEIMFHFNQPSASAYFNERSSAFSRCLEPVWSNLWTNKASLLSSDPVLDIMWWYLGARLLHLWANLCRAHDCRPEWGTSDVFWLLMFLWINQPNNERENPYPLIDSMQILECVGNKIFNDQPGTRVSAIVDQLLATYGEEALLRRYNEALGHSTIPLEHQHQVNIHVYLYGGEPSLCARLWGAGVVTTYLQSSRRRQDGGRWKTLDAELLFALLWKVVVASRDLSPHHIVSVLITDEHLMRQFILPGLWLVLESLQNPDAGMTVPAGVPSVNLLSLVIPAVTQHRTARKGSVGHAMMTTLTVEASPYWHLMNDAIHGSKPRDPACVLQKRAISTAWQQFGDALQLNRQRAPRQIDGPAPTSQPFCSWPLCVYHLQKPPHALKSCKGCAEVQYCGKRCQISDWKLNDHKTRCRRLKSDSE
ncbi:hypothetical protein PENSPDRAFT_252715 [Peniophora sp. CONT]|nr:hypothetical protein PENSPDRAFT_252715 [Peniophora sp. CONT]